MWVSGGLAWPGFRGGLARTSSKGRQEGRPNELTPKYAPMWWPHYPLGRIEIPGGARTPSPFPLNDLR
jgi:hypothetical protein